MNKKLLSVLCCPACRGEFELLIFQENGKGVDGSEVLSSNNEDVIVGLLKCTCGAAYPIIDGVPRLVESRLIAFSEFLNRCKDELRVETCLNVLPQFSPSGQREDDYDYIRQSFSKEWGFFDYAEDETWGLTLEARERLFLTEVALTEEQPRGKLLSMRLVQNLGQVT